MDAFSQNISEILKSGRLVDDEIVVGIVKNLKENPETFMDGEFSEAPGIILDGVPRTVAQAKLLQEFMQIDLIVNFFNRDDILMEKMMGRRVCPTCNKNFNIAEIDRDGYVMGALLPNGPDPTVCDEDGSKLIIREDDKEHIIRDRMELYKSETLPILDFYKDNTDTKVINFEAKRGKEDYGQVRDLLIGGLEESMPGIFADSEAAAAQ